MAHTTILIQVNIEHANDEEYTETEAWEVITRQLKEGYVEGAGQNLEESYRYTVDAERDRPLVEPPQRVEQDALGTLDQAHSQD